MNVTIINGSPKGMTSVTMQYCKYLEKKFPEHKFEYIIAAQKIKLFLNDEKFFNEQMKLIKKSDIIIWAFPLYYMTVNSQYKHFVEMINEKKAQHNFNGKYCGIICTSIHFFDHTAVNYINAVCDDLKMNYAGYYSAHMNDLMNKRNQSALESFFTRLLNFSKNRIPVQKNYHQIKGRPGIISLPSKTEQFNTDKKITIISDSSSKNTNTTVKYLSMKFPQANIINLMELKFGPCLGCLKCGFDNICAYEGKDDYIKMHRENVCTADIVIFVLTMKDRYVSYLYQQYLERSFYRTHQPTIEGKQIAFIIDGPLSENHNVKEILEGYIDVLKANSSGIISTENTAGGFFRKQLDALCSECIINTEKCIQMPQTFLGVGGMKIFRDDVYGGLKAVFQADHRYYKKHGIYDFPQKKFVKIFLFDLLILFTKIPAVKKYARSTMKENMLRPYKKIIDETVKFN